MNASLEPISGSNNRDGAGKLAAHLLQEGLSYLHRQPSPLQTGATTWPRGTFIARVSRNEPCDSWPRASMQIAKEAGVEVRGVNTAFPDASQYGTGSACRHRSLQAPRVAAGG